MPRARALSDLRTWAFPALGVALSLLTAACDDGETHDAGPVPLFPEDYASSYVEVRGCRQSGDHDLNVIRVLADPAALGPYLNHDQPIPEGAVLLKEEYDFSDVSCSGPVQQWTVMARLAQGGSPDTLDWRWQKVDGQRQVVEEDTPRCYGCHAACTADNGGYEFTCTVP
jgi:hypothetical protein